jgi:Uma2 family endonuclease
MAVMADVERELFGQPFTVDDLVSTPDDGRRYELLDGALLVTPAPGWAHQDAAARLWLVFEGARPPDLRAVLAPFAVQLSAYVELQPDVLVARYVDLTAKNLPVAPLLVVEILSPSTSLIDVNLKKAAYQRHGVRAYWIVDPDRDKPSVTVFELGPGGYAEVGHAVGDAELIVDTPFPVRLRPSDLLAGLDPG